MLHTVYVKVLEGAARYDGRASFRTWLFAVIRITACEGRRRFARSLRQAAALAGIAVEVDTAPSALERVCDDGERRRVEGLLGGLSMRQRQVLELVFYHDLTIEQAALAMGVSLGSARVHYQRGKQRLRAMLEGAEVPRG